MALRTVVERGTKGKKVVAFAVDWPGLSRNGKTVEQALATLDAYRPRYRPIASGARRAKEFDAAGALEVVEDKIGNGSTEFWGISFQPCNLETEPMPKQEFDRKLALLRSAWTFFDDVAATVSEEMRKGPRGGGRDRHIIWRHTIRTESEDFAKKVGVGVPEEAALTPEGLARHREDYVAGMRRYLAGELKPMRSWNLPFLLRHSAFHVMDHAWEMQDKDLTDER